MDRRCLLLSSSYQPLRAISWQRALTLVYGKRAEVVEVFDIDLHSPSQVIKMPAVVRLKRYFKRYHYAARFTKTAVMARDRHSCNYCGIRLQNKEVTLDHVIPLSMKGCNDWTNVTVACKHCNQRKGARTPDQAGMKLLKKPVAPTFLLGVDIAFEQNNAPPEWAAWLYKE